MRSASAIYKMVRALDTGWYEWRVVQGENIYGLDRIKDIDISYALTSGSGISIGNANSAECRMTLLEESANWERMARFTVDFRICLSTSSTKSEWITLGVFYTDQRSEDKNGNLSIIAYDKMLQMEQSWTDKIPEQYLPPSYPITARIWAALMQISGLAVFDDITTLDNTLLFVGLDTTSSIRDVLKMIATVHGGNWMMTTNETLKLVQFENVDSSQTSKFSRLALATQAFEDSPALAPVTGVHLETMDGTVMESGDDEGFTVQAICDVSDTSGIAALCLERMDGYVFRPFEANTAYLDPIVEIGDSVSIDDVIYQAMSIRWTVMKTPTANISAPYDQEIDHEYMVVSEDAKTYRKTMAKINGKLDDYVQWDEVSTAITQNAESVVIAASGTYVTQEEYDAQIAEIQNQLDGNIQSWSGNAVPTLNNLPASDWTTAAARAEHVGDMYFINSDAGIPEAGQYYRFEENNGVYSWQLITDSAITEALSQAAAALAAAEEAQDTADAASAEVQLKGRVFVNQPTPPYAVGDLWFNSADSVIKVCMTARDSGSFVDSDWQKRDKYTDDSAFEAFQTAYSATIEAIQDQLDQKAETYYQEEDPELAWDGSTIAGIAIAGVNIVGGDGTVALSHQGDLWYRTTDGTTWFWDGSKWVQQEVPDEVFDRIDGKAQIFISTPYTPYNVGDLWFDSANSDIMTCTVARATGDFNANDWQKRNKYTDDSTLTTFVSAVYNPAIAAIQSDLDGKVDTYFYAYAPTLQNVPASQWTTNADKDAHVDDLFFDTVSGYTYRFKKNGSTYSWERVKDSDITSAMTAASTAQDTADGKRRVFVTQPIDADEYDVGDLWVNATYSSTYSNDLLRCKTHKDAGAPFNIAHWDKASKYTDDTAANNVAQALVEFQSEFTVQPNQIRAEVEKRVIKDQSETRTTFGWELTDSSHKWYANNQEVVRIQQSGVYVKGEIRATTGYIGSDSTGFEINATNFHNGMTSLSDTTHNGVYVGTDGIALGQGKFKVTSSGSVTASNLDITGGSIKLGGTSSSPVFHVTSGGAVTASNMTINGGSITIRDSGGNVIFSANSSGVVVNGNGTFTGTVFAGNIVSGASVPGAGYFDGAGLTPGTVYGGDGYGQIAPNTLGDYNVYHPSSGVGAYTTASFSDGVQGSLGYADLFGYATQRGSATYPSYFAATSITALSSFYAPELYLELGGDSQLAVKTHYHSISVSQDGTVTIGHAVNLDSAPSFNIADTHFFEDYVSAIDVSSITRTYPDGETSYPYYDSATLGKIIEFKVQYQISDGGGTTLTGGSQIMNVPADAAYDAGYEDGEEAGADAVTITAITRTYPDGESSYPYYDSQTLGKVIEFKAMASMSNGNGDSEILTVPATAAYNAGYSDGTTDGSDAVTITAITRTYPDGESSYPYYDSPTLGKVIEFKAQASMSNGSGDSEILTVPATAAYNAGRTDGISEGASGVTITAITRTYPDGESSYPYYDSPTLGKVIEFKAQASMSNGSGGSQVLTVPATAAYNAGYTDGSGSGASGVTATVAMSGAGIPAAADQATISATATLTNSNTASGSYSIYIETTTNVAGNVTMQIAHGSGSSKTVLASKTVTPVHQPETATVAVTGSQIPAAADQATITATATLSGGGSASNTYSIYMETVTNTTSAVTMQVSHGSGSSKVVLAQKSVTPVHPTVTISASGMSSTSTDPYDQSIGLGASSLYTVASTQYGRIQISAGGVQRIVRVGMPADTSSSVTMSGATGLSTASTEDEFDFNVNRTAAQLYSTGTYTYGRARITLSNGNTSIFRFRVPAISSVTSITVTRTNGDRQDWQFEDGGVQVGVTLQAKNGNTVLMTSTGSVDVSDIVNFFGVDNSSILSTNNSNYETYDFTGYIEDYLYTTGGYRYGRMALKNNAGETLYTVRVQLKTSGSSVGTITLSKANASQSYNPYYPSIPDYAYMNNKHWCRIHAVSTGESDSYIYYDINDIVNFAYQQGGGGGGGISWVQILSSDYSLANKQVALYCYNSSNQLIYSNTNVRITYDDR